jgi:hypothetical protein
MALNERCDWLHGDWGFSRKLLICRTSPLPRLSAIFATLLFLLLAGLPALGGAGTFADTTAANLFRSKPACKLQTREGILKAYGEAAIGILSATQARRNHGSAEGKYFTTSDYAKQAVTAFKGPPSTMDTMPIPRAR